MEAKEVICMTHEHKLAGGKAGGRGGKMGGNVQGSIISRYKIDRGG